jgi:hypothetical protein
MLRHGTDFDEPVKTPSEHVIKVRRLVCQIISYTTLLTSEYLPDAARTFSEIRRTPTNRHHGE